jgi:glycosyltransferase involved in cell wall biosynthesis
MLAGFNVEVVTPLYYSQHPIFDKSINRLPLSRWALKIGMLFERLGFFDDYMDIWVNKSYKFLINKVRSEDIVFSTSGGELGCIKLGSLLKKMTGCKHVVNYHDPLDYSLVNGKIIDNRLHASREYAEYKYLKDSDLVITSSQLNKASLQDKYPEIAKKIVNEYFGYVDSAIQVKRKSSNKLSIAYGGSFTAHQSPDILAKAGSQIPNVDILFIGHWESYKPLAKYASTCQFVKSLPNKEYLAFITKNVDVGFVSLASNYLGACVPSKIFEYINLGIPILGALPDGDGKDIINNNGYGIAVDFDDIPALMNAIEVMKNPNKLNQYQAAIALDRDKWAMDSRMKKVVSWLQAI